MTPAPDTLAAIERVREALTSTYHFPLAAGALADLDTIAVALARTQKQRNELLRSATFLRTQRDAALARVERLEETLPYLSMIWRHLPECSRITSRGCLGCDCGLPEARDAFDQPARSLSR